MRVVWAQREADVECEERRMGGGGAEGRGRSLCAESGMGKGSADPFMDARLRRETPR